MKKTLQFFFSLTILSLTTLCAYAQPPAGGPGGAGGRNIDPEQRAERQAAFMQDTLLLSDDLTAEVKAVLLVYGKKMEVARTEANGDWDAMRTTMQGLRKEQDEELQAIIGDEQWTKWAAIRAEMSPRGPRGSGAPGQQQGNEKEKKKNKKT